MARPINELINNATLFINRTPLKDSEITIEKILSLMTVENRLGLGKDTIKFEAKPSVTEYDFAGKLDNSVKWFEEITGWKVSLEGDILDINKNLVDVSLMENLEDNNKDYKIFKPKERLKDTDYSDIIVCGELKGTDKTVIIYVRNTFNEDGLSITFKDKDNNAATLKFTGKSELDFTTMKMTTPFFLLYPPIEGVD